MRNSHLLPNRAHVAALLTILSPFFALVGARAVYALGEEPADGSAATERSQAEESPLSKAEEKRLATLAKKTALSPSEKAEFYRLIEKGAAGQISCSEGKFGATFIHKRFLDINTEFRMDLMNKLHELKGICVGSEEEVAGELRGGTLAVRPSWNDGHAQELNRLCALAELSEDEEDALFNLLLILSGETSSKSVLSREKLVHSASEQGIEQATVDSCLVLLGAGL